MTSSRLQLKCLLAAVLLGGCAAIVVILSNSSSPAGRSRGLDHRPRNASHRTPRELAAGRNLTVWWDVLPSAVRERAINSGESSNIHPSDYIGPNSCKTCHQRNYEAWSEHPHRWMNARASKETVKGDFSIKASIEYRGGRTSFLQQDGRYLMRLERGTVRRVYEVTQTIGSRFFQYYVGKQIEGPEPASHHFYHKDHVLHFGYWLALREWAPVVHIGPELPDKKRPDPFAPPDAGRHYAEYAVSCNGCHTTFALADQFGRRPREMGEHAPVPLHWSMRPYLEEARPGALESMLEMLASEKGENPMYGWDAERHAVTLGVSCEACHLGAKAHAESGGKVLPKFFPSSPHLHIEARKTPDPGRTHDNVNWACGRCHTGGRPQFAAGMSTWNSVEYSDAMRGSCYSKLRCIDCHSPHQALGPKWAPPPDKDDALCLKCHEKFEAAEKRVQHTHHPMGSEGARCMNCHMPRINEGLQDVVRTHMIYSPTRADMIEANHPNACNLCHTREPIDWTLRHLKQWYGKSYNGDKIAAAYKDRSGAAALGWLKSDNPAVRLVSAEAMIRVRDFKALPQLTDALDDPHLVNRQFAYKGFQGLLDVRLSSFGYRFYMTGEERRQPLAGLRVKLPGLLGAKKP